MPWKNITINKFNMKKIKKKTEILQLKFDPEWDRLDLNFGTTVFHLLRGRIMIDETPYEDETLVPIENIKTENNKFTFNSIYKKTDTYFEVDCSTYNGAIDMAEFIKRVNEEGLTLEKNQDNIDMIFENNEFSLTLGNEKEKKMIVIGYNQYRNYFKLRFPEPSKQYQIGPCYLMNQTIYINCVGKNQYDETDVKEGFQYEWKLNFPPLIQELVLKLLKLGLKNK